MSSVLKLSGIQVRYGSTPVLRNLELTVEQGAIYGFLGRNGAGKTTTIRTILGVLAPSAGTVTLGDRTVRRTTAAMRRDIGYVSQEQHFFDWMTARHLGWFVGAFYPTWDSARFYRTLERLVVPVDRSAGQLSGGTRLKLAIALALAHRPKLLILDEPTAGVDPVTRRDVLDLLQDEARTEGRTVLFSTHYVAEVEAIGTVVGVLHAGQLAYQGPIAGLCETPDGPRTLEDAFVAIARSQ
jgi:ABC-2 type transport system ATP-binding protein